MAKTVPSSGEQAKYKWLVGAPTKKHRWNKIQFSWRRVQCFSFLRLWCFRISSLCRSEIAVITGDRWKRKRREGKGKGASVVVSFSSFRSPSIYPSLSLFLTQTHGYPCVHLSFPSFTATISPSPILSSLLFSFSYPLSIPFSFSFSYLPSFLPVTQSIILIFHSYEGLSALSVALHFRGHKSSNVAFSYSSLLLVCASLHLSLLLHYIILPGDISFSDNHGYSVSI